MHERMAFPAPDFPSDHAPHAINASLRMTTAGALGCQPVKFPGTPSTSSPRHGRTPGRQGRRAMIIRADLPRAAKKKQKWKSAMSAIDWRSLETAIGAVY